MQIMDSAGIERYFKDNDFGESLVISYSYEPITSYVTLIADYAHDTIIALLHGAEPTLNSESRAADYHRDLRRLTFLQVSGYRRRTGSSKVLRENLNHYSVKYQRKSVVIHELKISRVPTPSVMHIRITFGDFGDVAFDFAHLQVDRLLVRSIGQRGNSNEWDYIDVGTRQPIDVLDPFKS